MRGVAATRAIYRFLRRCSWAAPGGSVPRRFPATCSAAPDSWCRPPSRRPWPVRECPPRAAHRDAAESRGRGSALRPRPGTSSPGPPAARPAFPTLARTARTASFLVMAGLRNFEHVRQHDRVREAVGRMVFAAQLVRDGVDIADVGPRERESRVGRRQRHLLARREVPAVPVGDAQVRRRSCRPPRAPCDPCSRSTTGRRRPRWRASARPCRWPP